MNIIEYAKFKKMHGGSSDGSGYSELVGVFEGTQSSVNNSDITTLRTMAFYNCQCIEEVTLPNLVLVGDNAFSNCKKLKKINMGKVTKCEVHGFSGCTGLVDVILPNLVSAGANAFMNDEALLTIDFPLLQTMGQTCFGGCKVMESANIPKITELPRSAFTNCNSLTTVNVPLATTIETYCFQNNYILERLDFSNLYTINSNAFSSCHSLKTLILRRTSGICSLKGTNAFGACYHLDGTVNETYNPNGDKDGYIYVPSALIEQYKVATNWSTYATQFRAIEDYPEICGEV